MNTSLLAGLETPEQLALLDAAGMPPGPGEDLAAYKKRLERRLHCVEALDLELELHGKATVFDNIAVDGKDRIPEAILQEAAEVTEALYGFSFREFPGFFISENVGLLWGGCLITDTESPLAVFFIRSSFREKSRFFIYRRQELLAHELCHAARHELADWAMDEFFAYQTSPSRLRRYLGNCFIRQRDALGFVLPAMMLLAAQILQAFWKPSIPVWPFWLLMAGMLSFLLFRNHLARREYFRAERHLRLAGLTHAREILFRSTAEERKIFARTADPEKLKAYLQSLQQELRWQVTLLRFA